MYIQKSPRQNLAHSNLQIGIGTNNRTILPPQLHQTRLQILPARPCDSPPRARASREVNLTDSWMLNHGGDDLGGVLRPTGNDVQAPCGEACVLECAADGPVAFWGEFGGFYHCCVSCC